MNKNDLDFVLRAASSRTSLNERNDLNKMKTPKSLPYPKSVFFIFVHQIFERFSFWGIVVILPLFLRNTLDFNDDSATALYHGFTIFGYLSSFVGAILADSYFGKFWTIIGFSIAYFFGTFLLTASATPLMSPEVTLAAAIIGLILTGLASGSIKPCIIAYGGDQFTLPQQQKQLDSYFPILYLIINFSLFFTAIITPMLRKDLSCFRQDSCYSAAFAVPFVLVIIAFVVFVTGRKLYKNNPVEENIILKALDCAWTAITEKFKVNEKRENWLDFADKKFDSKFIGDVKSVLSLFVLFLPVTVFWALFDQQFSRWTFQATRMDNNVFGYSIKPDQFATLNFVVTFLFIPFFEKVVYPILAKCNLLIKPLQKVVAGTLCASLAFVICACVELKIESTLQPIPGKMESQLNLINGLGGLPCNLEVQIISEDQNSQNSTLAPFQNEIFKIFLGSGIGVVTVIARVTGSNAICQNFSPISHELRLSNEKGYTAYIYNNADAMTLGIRMGPPDDLHKSLESNSKLAFIYDGLPENTTKLSLIPRTGTGNVIEFNLNGNSGYSTTKEIHPNQYEIRMGSHEYLISIDTFVGGNYILTIIPASTAGNSTQKYYANLYTIIEPNSVHIFSLIPQYMVMSIAEVMVEVPLTGFAYSQAPQNMKSVLQVVNLIPPALGGILVIFIAEAKFLQKQSLEFFLFAGINFGAVLLLIFLSIRYKPVGIPGKEEQDNLMKIEIEENQDL